MCSGDFTSPSSLGLSPPPSNPASTAQTPPCTCRGSSTPENPQYAASAGYSPPTPLPSSSLHHPTESETTSSASASASAPSQTSFPSRTPSPLLSSPTDFPPNSPKARSAV